jgi:hypothetical protein
MTIYERMINHLEYKIVEHSRAAADHQLQAETYRKFKMFAESEQYRMEKVEAQSPDSGEVDAKG